MFSQCAEVRRPQSAMISLPNGTRPLNGLALAQSTRITFSLSIGMTPDERITAIEQNLQQMHAAFDQYGRIHQQLAGQTRIYEAAVFALIASHPCPGTLAPVLADELAGVEAGTVAESNSEERLVGVQSAQRVLMQALAVAHSRLSDEPPTHAGQAGPVHD